MNTKMSILYNNCNFQIDRELPRNSRPITTLSQVINKELETIKEAIAETIKIDRLNKVPQKAK